HGKDLLDAADIARYRTQLQRRAENGFAQLHPVHIDEGRTEIFRFANDARVRHPRELVTHLDGNVLESAAYDLRGYRIDFGGCFRNARTHFPSDCVSIMMLPYSSTLPRERGGKTVVESCWNITAGPSIVAPLGIRDLS